MLDLMPYNKITVLIEPSDGSPSYEHVFYQTENFGLHSQPVYTEDLEILEYLHRLMPQVRYLEVSINFRALPKFDNEAKIATTTRIDKLTQRK